MNVGFPARTAYGSFALALLTLHAWAGGVRNVNQPALGIFFEIQDAVAAAADGDTLLVGGGDYGGFTLDGKALRIFGAPGQLIQIQGTVEVKNLASAQIAVLSGLEVTGATVYPTSKPALVLTNLAGLVRVQRCALNGGGGAYHSYIGGKGGEGATITNSTRVAFTSCSLQGGPGHSNASSGHDTFGGAGGMGLNVSGSSVAVHGCSILGGEGGEQYTFGGDGGYGGSVASSSLFASGCVFQGGNGGDVYDNWYASYGGDGGGGLRLASAAAHADLLAVSLGGGVGGNAVYGPQNDGDSGQPLSGPGTSTFIAGPARLLGVARDVLSDQADLTLTIEGAPGDLVFLVSSHRPGFKLFPTLIGPWLVHFPALFSFTPHGIIPPSGVLNLTVPVSDLAPSAVQRIDYLQAFCSSAGQVVLTGSVAIEVINPALPPDCNANAMNDYLDAITGLVQDCDHNLRPDACDPDCDADGIADGCEIVTVLQPDCNENHVPDDCDIAAGTSLDCNLDGQPDECQLASGVSLDQNRNGIPDECELNTTWHVEASAPAGGDGSAASPFDTIGAGFVAAISGDTILVRDGLYTGPANRNLDFLARELVVRSANGPASCVLELQLQGRAFVLVGQQTFASRIEGLTIRHGKPPAGTGTGGGAITTSGTTNEQHAEGVTIRDCVFEDCPASSGGAVTIRYEARIEDCIFRRNGIQTSTSGGAVHLMGGPTVGGTSVSIVRCVFDGNVGTWGGAIYAIGDVGVTISHCAFLGNAATYGGALSSNLYSQYSGLRMDVDDCLFAGNTASSRGGALYVWANNVSKARITQSSFSANSAGSEGGVVFGTAGADVSIQNSILWANSAPNGQEIALVATMFPVPKLAVAWSDVQGGQGAVYKPSLGQISWGAGNLDLDPAFFDPDGMDNNPLTLADNDYRLLLASSCIDAADNAAIPLDANDIDGDFDTLEMTQLDLDLSPRRADVPSIPDSGAGLAPIVDMGAYEKR